MRRRFLQSALAIAGIGALPRSDERGAPPVQPVEPAALFITDQAAVMLSGVPLLRIPTDEFFNVRQHWPALVWSPGPLQISALLSDANALLLIESLRHWNLRLHYVGGVRAAALNYWQRLQGNAASLPLPAAGRQWLICSIGATAATHGA
jgi:hypothetical protein